MPLTGCGSLQVYDGQCVLEVCAKLSHKFFSHSQLQNRPLDVGPERLRLPIPELNGHKHGCAINSLCVTMSCLGSQLVPRPIARKETRTSKPVQVLSIVLLKVSRELCVQVCIAEPLCCHFVAETSLDLGWTLDLLGLVLGWRTRLTGDWLRALGDSIGRERLAGGLRAGAFDEGI
jgi:hypothetical protein